MHDYTLMNIDINWLNSYIKIFVKNYESKIIVINCKNFKKFDISKFEEWGKSNSINEITPNLVEEKICIELVIEMQSGDLINISAENIFLSD